MTEKRQEKRQELRTRLIEAARDRIAAGGLRGLRARDVTADAGCALGGLYTAFADLNELVIHVNSDTLRRLGEAVAEASAGIEEPGTKLKAMALAYLAFARTHNALWLALFDTTMLADVEIPQWHKDDQAGLIDGIARTLAAISPDMDEDARQRRARTLFAAVHGIVSISLEKRFIGLSGDHLEGELESFVDLVARAPTPLNR
ncbi:TetR/AcrR family transcriptional regulator [Consotaella salsifontis]|uniref:Transcriptional regulator, TetR family n=1 Tax=Consotaella salsifontis TaxID=1365950 RepID=A0A1T4SII3_9HYPH|nr:WHG domain-containing protein [Consotaella salsifontis]SKA27738.1 transcriptional regulator, TetR family [Consotaella salsifontis]